MDRRIFLAVTALVIFSFAARIAMLFFIGGMWWDEAVYLGLGRGIAHGFYALESGTSLESFRPPLLPLLISPISENIFAVKVFIILTSALAVIAAYLLAKQMFGKDCALWVSLFVSTGQLFVFFSLKVLAEPFFISLVSLSLLFFFRSEHSKRAIYPLLAGAFAGVALVTRYLGTIIMLSYVILFIYLALRRNGLKANITRFSLLFAGFLAAVSPWLALSYANYGDALGAYMTNFSIYSGSFPSLPVEYVIGFLQFSGPQVIFFAIGLYAVFIGRKEIGVNRSAFLLILFALPIIFFSFAPHTESRYLLSYAPVYALFAGIALVGIRNRAKAVQALAVFACAVTLIAGLYMVWGDKDSGAALISAATYLKTVAGENDTIMSESYPYVYYFSQRRAVRFPPDEGSVEGAIDKYGVKYVLLYKYESGNPAYAAGYFENSPRFSRIMAYEQWGDQDAAVVYKVVA
jgi:4-amino-4-deoxy-L-arabinose transferase-like glycosyltransferase